MESLGRMADAIAPQTSSSSKTPKKRVTYPSSPGNHRSLAQIGEEHARLTESNTSSDPDWSNTQLDDFEFAGEFERKSMDEEEILREFERRKNDPNEYYFDLEKKTQSQDDENDEKEVGEEEVGEETSYDADSEFEGISEQLSVVSIKENRGDKRKRTNSDLVARYPKRSNRGKRD